MTPCHPTTVPPHAHLFCCSSSRLAAFHSEPCAVIAVRGGDTATRPALPARSAAHQEEVREDTGRPIHLRQHQQHLVVNEILVLGQAVPRAPLQLLPHLGTTLGERWPCLALPASRTPCPVPPTSLDVTFSRSAAAITSRSSARTACSDSSGIAGLAPAPPCHWCHLPHPGHALPGAAAIGQQAAGVAGALRGAHRRGVGEAGRTDSRSAMASHSLRQLCSEPSAAP